MKVLRSYKMEEGMAKLARGDMDYNLALFESSLNYFSGQPNPDFNRRF